MSNMQAFKLKLVHGLQDLSLSLTDTQIEQLVHYVLLIEKWNKVYNLTAIRDPMEMVTLHILDSLSVLEIIKSMRAATLLDVGAGAGLPSIPLAICLPELHIVAIDAVQKKVSFMRHAKGELGLTNFSVEVGRVEKFDKNKVGLPSGFDLIISRAFSEIGLFVHLTRHLIKINGMWLAMKGIVPAHEFEKTQLKPQEVIKLNVPNLDAERHLILLKKSI
jgi:16S rRNA (guanine527-N7)-methyltransferase